MLPADQGFYFGDPPVRERHDRLIYHSKLAPLERLAQISLQLQALKGDFPHACLEEGVSRLAGSFGEVQRDIGIAQQVVSRLLSRSAHRHAQARSDIDVALAKVKRADERRTYALGGCERVAGVADLLQHHGELVAAKSRRRVLGPHAGA